MAISKDKKNTLVADLTELLNDSKMVVYAKYEGLTVAELQELRKMAREAGVKIKVVKNRLVKVAMKEIATYKDTETSGLTGQLLYALGTDEDFDAAKVLTKFAKTHVKMELIGGFNGEGETLSKEEVTTLGNLPTKNELIAQVVDTLLSGINGIVSGLEQKAWILATRFPSICRRSAMNVTLSVFLRLSTTTFTAQTIAQASALLQST